MDISILNESTEFLMFLQKKKGGISYDITRYDKSL